MAENKQQQATEITNPTAIPAAPEQTFSAESIGAETNLWTKYQNIILGAVVGIALIGGGYFYLQSANQEKDTEAQELLFRSVYAFESDSLDRALKGKGTNEPGLVAITEEYSGTNAANQANFYIGAIQLKKGKFPEAIEALSNFKSNDLLIQARAYCLIGDAYLEQKNYAEAQKFYSKASDYYPNERFTPGYLSKLALAQELNSNLSEALSTYDRIVTKYPLSADVMEAKKAKARLEAATAE